MTLKKPALFSLILITLVTFFSIALLGSEPQKAPVAQSWLQNRYVAPFLAGFVNGFTKTVIVEATVQLLPQKMQTEIKVLPLGPISPAKISISLLVSKPIENFVEKKLFPIQHYESAQVPILHHTKIFTDSSVGKGIQKIPLINQPIYMLKTCQDQKILLGAIGNCVGTNLAKNIIPKKNGPGTSVEISLFGD